MKDPIDCRFLMSDGSWLHAAIADTAKDRRPKFVAVETTISIITLVLPSLNYPLYVTVDASPVRSLRYACGPDGSEPVNTLPLLPPMSRRFVAPLGRVLLLFVSGPSRRTVSRIK